MRISLALVGLLATLTGCSDQAAPAGPAAAVPVAVAQATVKAVPIEIAAVGNVQSIDSIDVRSRVTGHLAAVHFEEGQEVRRGQLLFTIDPRPFQAALRQAEAELARNEAIAENARREAQRYEELFRRGLVARSQYEKLAADAAAATAVARSSRAAVDNARLELAYTRIEAPIDGRTGALLVDPGALVRANETELVVVNRLRPIEVAFTVPAEHLPEIRRRQAERPLDVVARPAGDPEPVRGRLTFIDNQVDPRTGTVRLKATFANDDGRLWPGQFANVRLTLGVDEDAVVVPSVAVQAGQQGSYIFIVTPEGTAESRPVEVARRVGDETVIARGVAAGETVVTEGQLRLTPGARVELRQPPEPAAPPAASPRS